MNRVVEIQNIKGLHARAAAAFVKVANKFVSEITVEKEEHKVSASSIMGLMMLAASKGTKIEITAKGDDAEYALNALEELVNDKFNEE
jgi:phosphocarrier protein